MAEKGEEPVNPDPANPGREPLRRRRTALQILGGATVLTALTGGTAVLIDRQQKQKEKEFEALLDEIEAHAEKYRVIPSFVIAKENRFPTGTRERGYDYKQGADGTKRMENGDLIVSGRLVVNKDRTIGEALEKAKDDLDLPKTSEQSPVEDITHLILQNGNVDISGVNSAARNKPLKLNGYTLKAEDIYLSTKDPENQVLALKLNNLSEDFARFWPQPAIVVGNKNVVIDMTRQPLFTQKAPAAEKHYFEPNIMEPGYERVGKEDRWEGTEPLPYTQNITLRVSKAQMEKLTMKELNDWMHKVTDPFLHTKVHKAQGGQFAQRVAAQMGGNEPQRLMADVIIHIGGLPPLKFEKRDEPGERQNRLLWWLRQNPEIKEWMQKQEPGKTLKFDEELFKKWEKDENNHRPSMLGV